MDGFMSYAIGNNLSVLNVPFIPIVSVCNIPENPHELENLTKKPSEIHSIGSKHYISFSFTMFL